MSTSTPSPFAAYESRRNGRPSYWRLNPSAPLNVESSPPPELVAAARAAVQSKDPSSLLMTFAQAVEGGHARIAGMVARAALDLSMNVLPTVGPARLHATAIAGPVDLSKVSSVADLGDVASDLRLASTLYEIGWGLTSNRGPLDPLDGSRAEARDRIEHLAALLEVCSRGEPVQMVTLTTAGSFPGRTDLVRALCKLTTFPSTGVSPHEVSLGADLRRFVHPAAGLRVQLDVIDRDPTNTAARNSACACLVDLGRPHEGLDHLAVSLLQPDDYVGRTAQRALREAGYHRLVGRARDLTGEGRPTPRARQLAVQILLGIGRRAHAELAMTSLADATSPMFVFERRLKLDELLSGASR